MRCTYIICRYREQEGGGGSVRVDGEVILYYYIHNIGWTPR